MARQQRGNFSGFARLKLWQKCGLIAAPFLIPISMLLYLLYSANAADIQVAESERAGLKYLRPVKTLVVQLAQFRAASVQTEREALKPAIDRSFAELEGVGKLAATFKTKGTNDLNRDVAAAKAAWEAAKASTDLKTGSEKASTALTAALELNVDAWEFSQLALDPEATTYYIQDVMIARAVPGIDELGQLAMKPTGGKDTLDAAVLARVMETRKQIEREVSRAVATDPQVAAALNPALETYKGRMTALATRPDAATATEAMTALSNLYDAYEKPLDDLLAARASNYWRNNLLAFLGTLAGLIAVSGIAFLVIRSITRQVDTINATFEQINAGDYTVRAPVQSADAIGQMATSLNATLDNTLTLIQSKGEKDQMQQSIMKLLDEVSGVADGDLTKEAEVSADMTGAIADSFNFMIDQLRKIIGSVQAATLQVSTAANEIYASADDLVGGSENQAEQIVTTSAAIDEIAVSIQQVSENAAESTRVAQQALANAKQGNTAVRGTIEGMNRIREQAQETAKRIKRLGETTQEIGQIVQLIDDIADRTSILALNASIQAAAAGDAGRGFAVVAEEVERLAVRSTDATKKISALVKAIQGETNEAVGAMEKSIQEVVSGSRVANQAGQALGEIELVSGKLAELIQSISLASKQQARGSEALVKSMGDISQITQQTTAGTKQTAESVNGLAKLSDELSASVSQFRLPPQYSVSFMPGLKVKPQVNGDGRAKLPAGKAR